MKEAEGVVEGGYGKEGLLAHWNAITFEKLEEWLHWELHVSVPGFSGRLTTHRG